MPRAVKLYYLIGLLFKKKKKGSKHKEIGNYSVHRRKKQSINYLWGSQTLNSVENTLN